MATKTPNFNLSKAELTDAIQSTILANNENFDIIDEALKNSGGDCNIPKFVGTEENPIDFSNLFEGMGNETDGWYQGVKIGQVILKGYVHDIITNTAIPIFEAFNLKDVFKDEALLPDEYIEEDIEILFNYMYCSDSEQSTNMLFLFGPFGSGTCVGMAFPPEGIAFSGFNEFPNISDVLTITNEAEYTPTSDYHPATKKYVDDTVANAGGGSTTYTLPAVGESQTIETLYGDYTLKAEETKQKVTVKSSLISENSSIPSTIRTQAVIYDAYMPENSLSKSAFSITVNGETKTIVFGENEGSFQFGDDVSVVFQEKIDSAFGAGKIDVGFTYYDYGAYSLSFKCAQDILQFPFALTSIDDTTKTQLETDLGYTVNDTLGILGVKSGATNLLDLSSMTVADFLETTESEMTLTINDYSLTVNTTVSISDLFETVNTEDNNIEIKYDFPHNVFTISDIAAELTIEDNLNFFYNLGFTIYEVEAQTLEDVYIVSVTNPNGVIKRVQLSANTFGSEGVLALLTILQKEYEEKINDLEKKINEILSKLEGGVS